ncbi:CDP-alcohol phosphatidyltransferase family protein [Legionella pneumophila]|uniref:CDP-alcohol phosphatidyltransferase family protein n=1 Tax=Legionella TaxID=445 RepID=UPI0010417852|nr:MULTISPECIES: CDP-alcohol phosphatidyltransferase family protein [Legionella]HAT9146627.1 CDP-alcohol phosphatidyltransferase family protein [Legionella pneumophila subsp. pneumophila]MCW8398124.1 CDP-alcohol phosphatidyltransferase family protein [Legionella sp. PATHC038]MCW8431925.1 CDP-alcohol phosphatidyltransferase family protein [Legionella pneumophila]HAT8125959.1 CDP-alcohol phosphatidyltransferase family protein [Legionella pneumophila]HCE5342869.1 CDP-alcohol phosphatidyltransfera
MIEQYLRPLYQRLCVNPITPVLIERVTPNQVTFFSGVLGLLVIPALWLNLPYLAISLLLLSGYCDTLDGTIARLTNHCSDWGSVLDIMTDRVVEVGVVFALWAINPNERGLGSLLMMASILLCITSFLVVGIFKTNDSEKSFHYSPGLIERAEAFVFFIAMMLWPNHFLSLAMIFSLLVIGTAMHRLYEFHKQSI